VKQNISIENLSSSQKTIKPFVETNSALEPLKAEDAKGPGLISILQARNL
jgi:hypothetical protein